MRTILLIVAVVIFYGKLNAQQFFTIALDGSQQSPNAVNTAGTGTGWAVLSADKKTLTYSVTFNKLTGVPSAAHFHYGKAGSSGAVAQGVTVSGNGISGTWDLTKAGDLDSLMSGKLYLNIHTAQFPAGEIRGQVNVARGVGYAIGLSGSNQNPAVSTQARGTGYAVLWNDSTLVYRVTIAGLSSNLTALHFHYGAAAQNGGTTNLDGLVLPFPTDSTTTSGSSKLSAKLVDSLRLERLYVNIHTASNAAGEIRGQARIYPLGTATSVKNQLPITTKFTGIAPNPVQEMAILQVETLKPGIVSVELFDSMGKNLVTLLNEYRNAGLHNIPVNMNLLQSGMYFCRITAANGAPQMLSINHIR